VGLDQDNNEKPLLGVYLLTKVSLFIKAIVVQC
jgi:hypothetical protein